MNTPNGIIIILSYPDTVVRPATWEISSKIWPLLGVGGKNAVQAGHAALLLIEKGKPKINYFDFGRYITTFGNGRVRCKEKDVELIIPILASFNKQELLNLEDILLWIEKNPEKTHGDGRLVASINTEINFEKAHNYIQNLIAKKEIPYGAFVKNGSNCARFVTDTITSSCTNKKINLKLKRSNLFTPSPIGNVIKGNTDNCIYEVYNGKISNYENRSIVKEYKKCFFKKIDIEINLTGTELPNSDKFYLENATWLGGIGSGAWFKISEKTSENLYKIERFTANGKKDFQGFFLSQDASFQMNEAYHFLHPSSCMEVFVLQKNKKYVFKLV